MQVEAMHVEAMHVEAMRPCPPPHHPAPTLLERSVQQAKQLVDELRACEDELSAQIMSEVIAKRATPPPLPPQMGAEHDTPTCPICQDEYSAHEAPHRHWVKLGCGHWYCEECLLTHVRIAEAAYNKCPLCRGTIADNPAVQEVDEKANLLSEALDMQMESLALFASAYRQRHDAWHRVEEFIAAEELHEWSYAVPWDVSHVTDNMTWMFATQTNACVLPDLPCDCLWWWRVLWSLRFGALVPAASGCAKLPSSWGCTRAGVIGGGSITSLIYTK